MGRRLRGGHARTRASTTAIAENIREAARSYLAHLLPNDRKVQLGKKPAPGQQMPDIEVVVLRYEQDDAP